MQDFLKNRKKVSYLLRVKELNITHSIITQVWKINILSKLDCAGLYNKDCITNKLMLQTIRAAVRKIFISTSLRYKKKLARKERKLNLVPQSSMEFFCRESKIFPLLARTTDANLDQKAISMPPSWIEFDA